MSNLDKRKRVARALIKEVSNLLESDWGDPIGKPVFIDDYIKIQFYYSGSTSYCKVFLTSVTSSVPLMQFANIKKKKEFLEELTNIIRGTKDLELFTQEDFSEMSSRATALYRKLSDLRHYYLNRKY